MRTILIDPATQTITDVEHDGQVTWRTIVAALGCDTMCSAGRLPNGDILWVDDEGLLHGPKPFFSMTSVNMQPLAGRGLITGPEELPPGKGYDDADAEIVSARTPLAEVQAKVLWLDRMAATSMKYEERQEAGITIFEQKTTIEPV